MSRRVLSALSLLPVLLAIFIMRPSEPASAQEAAKAPDFAWKKSLPIEFGDPRIGRIGGTEIRSLVTFDGRLFAANGYWSDSQEDAPALPGAQILRLDEPGKGWKVDLEVNERNARGLRMYQAISVMEQVRFTTDRTGQKLAQPVDLLLAAPWKRGPGLELFSRVTGGSATPWTRTTIPGQEDARATNFRAFQLHRDAVSGVDIVFAGAKNSIFSGAYDQTRQRIEWSGQTEWRGAEDGDVAGGAHRVASFANCNGKLYAAAYDEILERTDGPAPSWRPVFTTKLYGQNKNATGFRGLTCIPDGAGANDSLLVGVEDNPSRIYRITSGGAGGYKATQELDVSSFLTRALGTEATYVVIAYNGMTPYPDPSGASCPRLLIGFEANTPDNDAAYNRHDADAHFLIRDCHGGYAIREVVDPQIKPKPQLISVRALAVSPFASDPPGTVYAGGFDANHFPSHNTAWLYVGTPRSAGR